MRHEKERADAAMLVKDAEVEVELRRAKELQLLGVDLTKYLCAAVQLQPDRHLRIDANAPTAVHLEVPERKAR